MKKRAIENTCLINGLLSYKFIFLHRLLLSNVISMSTDYIKSINILVLS